MAIKCAFFDFDGVLRSWDYEANSLEEDHGIPRGAMWEIVFAPENVVPAVRGEITDEAWRSNVCRILIEKFPENDAQGAWDAWSSSSGELFSEVLEIIQECKSKIPVGLMTNATSRLNTDLETLGIADLFNYVINASEIGSIKPEPGIFMHAVATAGVKPREAFFADDKAENVEAAEHLGYVGHVFETPAGLRTALVSVGVL